MPPPQPRARLWPRSVGGERAHLPAPRRPACSSPHFPLLPQAWSERLELGRPPAPRGSRREGGHECQPWGPHPLGERETAGAHRAQPAPLAALWEGFPPSSWGQHTKLMRLTLPSPVFLREALLPASLHHRTHPAVPCVPGLTSGLPTCVELPEGRHPPGSGSNTCFAQNVLKLMNEAHPACPEAWKDRFRVPRCVVR